MTESDPFDPLLMGVQVKISVNDQGVLCMRVFSRVKEVDKYKYDAATVQELQKLLKDLEESVESTMVHSECKVHDPRQENNRVTYPASPCMTGHPWKDWGMFDCSKPHRPDFRNHVLCQMKAFVDLTDLPATNAMGLKPGILLITEPTYRDPDGDQNFSMLFEPWMKKENHKQSLREAHNNTQLINMSKLGGPAVIVIQDLRGNKRTHFRLKPRFIWETMYEDWLESDHTRMCDEEEEHKEE